MFYKAKEAAQIAANKLRYQHPNAKMGFLRQRKDGTTSLAILTPCNTGALPGTTEVPVTLGKCKFSSYEESVTYIF